MNRIAFIFPGQGSQYIGMGKNLFEQCPVFKDTYVQASDYLGYDMAKLCFEGDEADLAKTENAQAAVLTFSVAAYRSLLDTYWMVPTYYTGHSLGEISALCCSGTLNFKHALEIVSIRGKLMAQSDPNNLGGMSSISKIHVNIIEDVLKKDFTNNEISVGCYNNDWQTIISGAKDCLGYAGEIFSNMGAKVTNLNVSGAFHSPMMKSAEDEFNQFLKDIPFELSNSVISSLDGNQYTNPNQIVDKLTKQLTSPVRWSQTLKFLINNRVDVLIELGPQSILKNLCSAYSGIVTALSYDNLKERNEIAKYVHNRGSCLKKNINDLVDRCLSIAVSTKNIHENMESYYEKVVIPYNRLLELKGIAESDNAALSEDIIYEAKTLLQEILNNKGTSSKEEQCYMNEILTITKGF